MHRPDSILPLSCFLLAVALVGCPNRSDDDDTGTGDDDDTAGDPCEGVDTVAGTGVTLLEYATGLSSPVHITSARDGSGRLFVVEQGGTIKTVTLGGSPSTYLSVSGVTSGGEQGLLSLAFHPNFADNGKLYVYYTATGGGAATVAEYTVTGDPLTDDPDSGSKRVLLEQPEFAANHNGGQLAFGPDGYLYIGLGDGGGAGDTANSGQSGDTFLGKILRIDVGNGDPYGIPADNPFVNDPGFRDEIWMYGMRNPWRFSFDRETGALWVADVGQYDWEEISIGEAGGNFGWRMAEGEHCFVAGCDLSQYVPPIYEYGHGTGISITGGFVYRGCKMPELHGNYFFSDYNYSNSPLWTLKWDGSSTQSGDVDMAAVSGVISSFGEDEQGEIYIADHTGGRVLKIVPN